MSKMLRMTEAEYARRTNFASLEAGTAALGKFMGERIKPNKYRNQKTEVDGVKFDSKREAIQDSVLVLRQKAGEIRGLQRQVEYRMEVNGQLICKYVADWTYWEGDKFIVRDAKGIRTTVYQLKKRLLRALYGLEILET